MSRATISIRVEHLKRIRFIKSELRRKVLKSICVNNNIKNEIKFFSYTKLRNQSNTFKISRHHKVCLVNGRQRGVFKKFMLSRHVIKDFSKEARIQNLKTISW